MHGDKRSQGCELCEGGDGYPYKFVCKNGGWEKVMCDNGTFCTEMGRCQAQCQPYVGQLLEVNCSKYLKPEEDWPITDWDILLLSVYVLEERQMFDRDIPFTLRIFALNSAILNGVCLTVSLLKLISDKIWITKALQAYQDANVKAWCLSTNYVTWHEATDYIFPLPVLFCLQYYVFNQGIKYYLIIEIIFEAVVFIFEIAATLFAFIAYVRIHFKLKTLMTDKSDINALGAAVVQSICPNIILFIFFIYDLNNWYLPIYKEKVDARINAVFGNYNTDDDHFFTFLKTFEILMEFAKKYITLLKPFMESCLILLLMPPFRNEILFHIRKLPWLKKDEVQNISQTSVNAISIRFN
uniref:Uncharacterized protein n=1 Tax=Panagrolaimus sp. ES5 TaxID=591445 RepID=A0AC34FI55_9BILA